METKKETIRGRKLITRDETLLIFNATMDKARETFLEACEEYDFDIVTLVESYAQGLSDHRMIVHLLHTGAKNVGLFDKLQEEMEALADALINDPDMGGLSYDRIANLASLRDACKDLENKVKGEGCDKSSEL